MLEFEILQELEPNAEILDIIKDYENGRIKHLKTTNLQFIEPTEYVITKSIALTIFEYKVNEKDFNAIGILTLTEKQYVILQDSKGIKKIKTLDNMKLLDT